MQDEEKQLKISQLIDRKWRLRSIGTVRRCIKGLKNTNAFMLMTINRCIDYTKISKGLKLMPRRETINLSDIINMPLECMKNIQEKIDIVLNPIPSNVCSHIITDCQWLQENLLCLLSNAVKYSSSGTVDISIYLTSGTILSNLSQEELEKSSELLETRKIRTDLNISSESDTYSLPSIHIYPEENESRTNASSPSKNSPPMLKRTFSQVQTNLFLRFDVQDMGIGLEEEAMKTLFSPFKQAQRLAGGTGNYLSC